MRLVLVDIGNSAIKVIVDRGTADSTMPWSNFDLSPALFGQQAAGYRITDTEQLAELLLDNHDYYWLISSVNPVQTLAVTDWLAAHRPQDNCRVICHTDIPLQIGTTAPDRVGVDRLTAALGAKNMLSSAETAIVVDAGTAVTIDLVTASGTFGGGLIYPGPDASFRQLNEQTAALPSLDIDDRRSRIDAWSSADFAASNQQPWQTNTVDAILAGVYRTQLAGLSQNVIDFAAATDGAHKIYLTGAAIPELLAAGAALNVRLPWNDQAKYYPQLVLDGLRSLHG